MEIAGPELSRTRVSSLPLRLPLAPRECGLFDCEVGQRGAPGLALTACKGRRLNRQLREITAFSSMRRLDPAHRENKIQAQKGRYRAYFRDAPTSSSSRTVPASTVAAITCDTTAALLSAKRKRSRNDWFASKSHLDARAPVLGPVEGELASRRNEIGGAPGHGRPTASF